MNIIELAKEAGLMQMHSCCGVPDKFCKLDVWQGDLKAFADLVRAEREWVDLTDDEKVVLSDRLNLDRRIVVMDAVIAAFKEKNK